MLTKQKEYVLGQDREALYIFANMHGDMGFDINPDGSVPTLECGMIDVDKNRNNEGVSS
jgi:hypothetical protein